VSVTVWLELVVRVAQPPSKLDAISASRARRKKQLMGLPRRSSQQLQL
jgi:hypothetical protein